jgi:hypothetical protein
MSKSPPRRRQAKTVWIYVDLNKPITDLDHVKVFASGRAADRWLAENDEEVVWGYEATR